MPTIIVNPDDSFEEWRLKTNQISSSIAGVTAINSAIVAANDTVTISTQSTERLRVDSIGNLGSNVVPSAWVSTTKALQMPAGALYSTSTTLQGHAQNAYLSGTGWKYTATGYASRYEQTLGGVNWYTAVSGTANANITWKSTIKIDVSGNLLSVGGGGVGYGVGSGGTVTQSTSKSTTVTLDKPSGQITMNAAALAANTTISFTLNSASISDSDNVNVNIKFGAAGVNYQTWVYHTFNGGCYVALRNISGSSLAEAVVISFTVIKGSTS